MWVAPQHAPVIVITPNMAEGHEIGGWLRCVGLHPVFTMRTCDEAIFLLGRGRPSLLVIDESIAEHATKRLQQHIGKKSDLAALPRIRLTSEHRAAATGDIHFIRKPLVLHDFIQRVGVILQRPDLLGRLDLTRDQTAQHLEAARQMQIGLLPPKALLQAMPRQCGVGISALYRSGEAVGGDFWGVWPTGRGRFSLALVDFAGHGLSAALNTFRLHALLTDQTLPRGLPTRMTRLLNARLHALLSRGQYATMVYLHVDPHNHAVAWCGAGGPPPMFVSPDGPTDLEARGLPLGVVSGADYRPHWKRLPPSGILAVFSDGLFESGAHAEDVPRAAIAEALTAPARLAAGGYLTTAAEEATERLGHLRDRFPCPDHSDDIMAICVAFGPPELVS